MSSVRLETEAAAVHIFRVVPVASGPVSLYSLYTVSATSSNSMNPNAW